MIRRAIHYFSLHAQNFLGAFGRLLRQPVGSLMTVIVIAIALALPAGLRVLVNNFETLSGSWAGAIDFSVYLTMDVEESRARELAAELEGRGDELGADPGLQQMPLSGTAPPYTEVPLPQADIDLVRTWILDGAPE